MRHRCEACGQLVSFAGHNCPAVRDIAILKRGAKVIGAKLIEAMRERLQVHGDVLLTCPECGAVQLEPSTVLHGLGCSRGAKLTHASSLENAAIKMHGDPDAFGRVISVDEGDDEDPLESDAVRAYESSIADMLNEREAEGDDEG